MTTHVTLARRTVTAAISGLVAIAVAAGPAHAQANGAPTAPDQSITMAADTSMTINLYAGASDPDGDPFTPTEVQPTHGSIGTVNPVSGNVDFTPEAGYTGAAGLTYRLVDSHDNLSGLITVTITVVSGNLVAVDDTVSVIENGGIWITPMTNDYSSTGQMGIWTLSSSSHGGIYSSASTGNLLYMPTPGFSGTDSFTYTLSASGLGVSNSATVTVTVLASSDHPPVGGLDSFTVMSDTPSDLSVLGNDTDPDGDSLSLFHISVQPAHGTAVITDAAAGVITYTPDPGFVGDDWLKYYVEDAEGMVSTQTHVALTVQSSAFSGTDPVITGTPEPGSTLSVSPPTFTPSDGVTLEYQWIRGGADIAGATAATYPVTLADAGTNLAVRVTAHRGGYTLELTSDQVEVNIASISTPTVSGTPRVGRTLTTDGGTWAGSGLTLDYQWLRDGSAIGGATSASYTLVGDDAGHHITVRVTASKAAFPDVSATAGPVAIAAVNLTRPGFTGVMHPGKWLRATKGSWQALGYTFGYQWLRDGHPIKGATHRRLRLTSRDVGHRIAVRVVAHRPDFPSTRAVSKARACR